MIGRSPAARGAGGSGRAGAERGLLALLGGLALSGPALLRAAVAGRQRGARTLGA